MAGLKGVAESRKRRDLLLSMAFPNETKRSEALLLWFRENLGQFGGP